MAEPYLSQAAYFADLMELVSLRLGLLQLDGEPQLQQRQQIARWEQRMAERTDATYESGSAVNLPYLFQIFHLTPFERHCVSMALAAELNRDAEQQFISLQPDGCRLPSLSLCLCSFAVDEEEYVRLLGEWHLRKDILFCFFREGIQVPAGQSDLTMGLKLHRRIVSFALDHLSEDPELEFSARLHWAGEGIPPLVIHREMLVRMERCYAVRPEGAHLCFYLQGDAGSGRQTLARHFCKNRGRPLLTADLSVLLKENASWEQALLPVFREAALRQAALAFTGFERLLGGEEELPSGEEAPVLREWEPKASHIRLLLERAARFTDILFLFSREEWPPQLSPAPWVRTEYLLEQPDASDRLLLWDHYLKDLPLSPEISLEALAAKFAMQPGQIAAAANEAAGLLRWEGRQTLDDNLLHQACRAQLSHSLGKKATLVKAKYTWEDLILPPEQKNRLKEACDQVAYQRRVYEQWGFGGKVAYGRGVSMLFNGPPGTGKTMAAQVIANRLHLELYKVDLSGVISKYIGETEKQLGAVFDEVKKSQSILFFDEADALFGKRSETKDSHDRYANIQTSYLLQKMEEYDGIVILASNFLQNFDEAFRRRLKFIIEFTLPDEERREQIWRSVMPAGLPRDEDIDFEFLARSFELSGSSIKNIVVSAAFLAAAENSPLGMVHLLLAVRSEQQKAGKHLGRPEFGEYYHQISDYLKNRQE